MKYSKDIITAQKIMLCVFFILFVIGFVWGGVTYLQMLPIVIALILGKKTQDGKIDKTYMVALSIVMLVVNVSVFSIIDILLWTGMAYTFFKE